MDRKIVLNHIKYLETMDGLNSGISMHPETKSIIEQVHYRIEHNLPVKKELLYEACPYVFETEL